jgi:hypothetical protein
MSTKLEKIYRRNAKWLRLGALNLMTMKDTLKAYSDRGDLLVEIEAQKVTRRRLTRLYAKLAKEREACLIFINAIAENQGGDYPQATVDAAKQIKLWCSMSLEDHEKLGAYPGPAKGGRER